MMEDTSPRMRPYLESWDNEDKYSVANSQAPLQDGEDDHPERGTWTGKFDFLLSLLGYSVGLGNVWRFPYLCYSNGGGAFLIPFTIMLIIAGLPLMFMELSLGQYASLGPVAAYQKFSPLLRGLGYGMVLVSSVVMLYYNLIIAWTIHYMFASIFSGSSLPWSNCEPEWSGEDCIEPIAAEECAERNNSYFKRQCLNSTQMTAMGLTMENITSAIRRPPAEEYFEYIILFNTRLRLTTAKVWGDAAVQIFFALSPAWGGLITLSSYNKFDNNCYKDSLIVAVSNIGTSFFAGLVIFSVIGFLAHELGVPVASVVDQGAGLAFIVYPEVVARLPIAPVWSLLFFVMLLTLGLDSQFALMETVTTAILDGIPSLRNFKTWVVLGVSIFGYAGGLVFTTNAGMYWLQLMDKYAANWSVLLIAIAECILVAWVYGADRFLDDIQMMIGKRGKCWRFFWKWMWKIITPATLFFILFFNWVEYEPLSYGTYIYPRWADAVGWIVGLFPVCVILIMAAWQIKSTKRRSSYDEDDDDDYDEETDPRLSRSSERVKKKRKKESIWIRARILLQATPEWRPASKNFSSSRNLTNTSLPGQAYDSVRDTIVLVNGQPLVQQPPPTTTTVSSSSSQKLPGPSILKNSSKADLITSQQV
ncbi:hypothetical protein HCN44_000859 [Aphidius gifuensis]|uniref:Transporter n=1 Tax=Aphidius gifuensis TaxID=684658 RepID=A0A834XTN8_APHGI|nr:hypothetical protein HCN44_000859 [Aphidius gifuensis]